MLPTLIVTVTLLVGCSAGPRLSGRPRTVDEIIKDAMKTEFGRTGPKKYPDGSVLVEMDMRLSKEQYESIHGDKNSYKGLRDERYRWTNNTMPYVIADYFSAADKVAIREGMDEWEKYSCLKLVPRTTERDFVNIISGAGCWSMVGMNGGRQDLSLQIGSCVYHHTIVHELGHAVGFHHEQTRPDRDEWVTVHRDNIMTGLEYNFDKYGEDLVSDFNVKYDYWSVMHYGQYAFSKKGKPTIETHDPDYQVVIGSVPGLSFKDIQTANIMYKCADHCTNTCPAKAIRTKDCKCWCNTGNPKNPVEEWTGGECKGGDDVDEACIDYYDECPAWEKQGECANNAYWMSQNCMKSCRVCGPNPACRDFDSEFCPYWAMIGECQRNPGWMMVNCRLSCKVCGNHTEPGDCEDRWDLCASAAKNGDCETHSEAMLTECPVSCGVCGDNVVCKNWDSRCKLWADEGKCKKDPDFMKLQCGQACKTCTGGTFPDCRDYAKVRDCEWWASNGECGSNPGWMLRKCPKSCLVCGEDAVCMDRDPNCHWWAFNGECETNKEYMGFACRHECGFCKGHEDDKAGCKNYDHNCDRWVKEGECDINPDGMLWFCPRGCKACGPGTLCKDWHDDCPVWSKEGECKSNPNWMNVHCPKSCDECCEDPDGCSSVGGPDPGQCDDYASCYEYEEDCEEKAAAGECFKNPDDMLRLCPLSCKLCGKDAECHNYMDDCEGWAFTGECKNNPSFMETYCRKACRCCEHSGVNTTAIPDSTVRHSTTSKPDLTECDDYEPCTNFRDNCDEKAAAGHCFTNPGDMLRLCPVSCRLCGKDAQCNNYHTDCYEWAQRGECVKNPSYMHMYCRKACQCC